MPTFKLLTLHAPLAPFIDETVFDTLKQNLAAKGVHKWWVAAESLPDIVVMIDIPDELMESKT